MDESLEPQLQPCGHCGAVLDVSEEEPLAQIACPACGGVSVVAATVGPFELLDAVGRGGMGVVYRARDISLDRDVALKVLRRETSAHADQIAKLESEAAITASINHPHVVKVFTTGSDGGRFYIAMELVDKGTLDSLITLQGRVAEAQVLEVGIQIAQGLRAAQQAGLIHRDVKPGNILFADAHTAKIVDFGLAIFQEDEAASRGEVWGTPYYVAPEKLDQKPEDFRSDIYSLGGTLFHALAGRPPFEAENASMVALKHLKSQAMSLQAYAPWVSSATAYVINRTLAKDPDERYQSYDELIEHLEYAKAELEKAVAQPALQKRVVVESEEEQSAVGLIMLIAVGIIVVAVAGFFIFRAFKADDKKQTPKIVGATKSTEFDAEYGKAKDLLIAGKTDEAAKAFDTLGAKKLPQPLLNWVNFHEGLAEFAEGRLVEGQAAFREIAARGPFSSEPSSSKLASFFVDTAKLAEDGRPIPASAASKIDKTSHEALALLVFALKDWQLEQFDDAGALLRQFDSAQPAGGAEWVKDYKKVVSDYLSDFGTYREATLATKLTKTLEEKKQALKVLNDAKKSLKLGGKLAQKIDSMRVAVEKSQPAGPSTPVPSKSTPTPATKLASTPWTFGDIGKTGAAGKTKLDGEVFTITGSGEDIWGNADSFHFVWQPMTGDGEIVAHVTKLSDSHEWTKAGVMLRESLEPKSRNVFALVSGRSGLAHQRRPNNGDASTNDKFEGAAPVWLKLVRQGNRITTFRSTNGADWIALGADDLSNLPANVFMGLAVSSHDTAKLATATFDNVKLTGKTAASALLLPRIIANLYDSPLHDSITLVRR